MVEHVLGKDEVIGSIPIVGSRKRAATPWGGTAADVEVGKVG
jgi:hypothetical protein